MTIADHKGFWTGQGSGAFTIKTYGFDELHNALKYLPEEIQTKCVEQALRKGGKEIVNAAKANVHSQSGALAKSISLRTDKKALNCTVWLGPFGKTVSMGKSGKMVKPFYAHMIEWGTKSHIIKSKKGKALLLPTGGHPVYKVDHPGFGEQRPFTRAFDEKRTAFLWQFGDYVDKFIKKHFQKWASNIIRGSHA